MMLAPLRNLLRAVFRHDAMNREMNDEMRAHLDRATERLVARGLSLEDAASQARREFGNASVLAEQGRDARGAPWVEVLRGDLRYGWRSLRGSPGFTAVAVLSLAIGIGANTTIFSLINAVMLKPLPVANPSELLQVTIRDSLPRNPQSKGNAYFTNPLWEQLRDATSEYASYAVSDNTGFSLVTGGELRSAAGLYVNGDFFRTLGVRASLGRTITAADDYPGCPATVVLGDGFWRTEFGAAPDVVGRTMPLEGRPFTIVGVVSRDFFGIDVGSVQQVYVPLCAEAVIRGASSALASRSNWWLRIIARPKPGVAPARLAEQLGRLSRPIMEASVPPRWDASRKAEFAAAKLHTWPAFRGLSDVRAQYSLALKVLMGMVGLILLIACANVANLSLARSTARAREIAVRVAIGASRTRILRQLITEATLLAAAGTAAGIAIAMWGTRLLVNMLGTGQRAVLLDLSPDVRVLLFTTGTTVATVLLFGLVPAWRATRVDPQLTMKAGGRGTAEGHNRFRLGKALVVAQSALAFVLVVGAGLLVTTFVRLSTTSLGFEPEGVLIARVRLASTTLPPQRMAIMERMRAQIEAVPGARSVSTLDIAPLSDGTWNEQVVVDGDAATAARPAVVWFNAVGSGYFRTMGTRVIAGRELGPRDRAGTTRVAVVNEAAVRTLFEGASPIGRTFHTVSPSMTGERTTVVGVVESSPYSSLRAGAEPVIFIAAAQEPAGSTVQFVVRAGESMPAVMTAIRSIVSAAGPETLLMFTQVEDQISRTLQRERALATLSALFGALALLLAMMGLYGLLAYTLARRRVEIGIRIALGAAAGRVVRMVLTDVGYLVGAGIVIGAVAAYAGAKVLGSLLYGVAARDPLTILGAAMVLAAVALLAGAIPARRAATVQPVAALRED